MSKLTIIDPQFGDVAVEFSVEDKESLRKAREEFTNRIKGGYTALTKDGKVLKSFDPTEEETFLIMPLIGG
jgi:hypothetical protein